MARRPARLHPRRWTGIILVIIVLVWSSHMTSAQIASVAALMTAIGALVTRLG